MDAKIVLATAAVLSLAGLGSVMVGLRVWADPAVPDDWRVKLVPGGVALVVLGSGMVIIKALSL